MGMHVHIEEGQHSTPWKSEAAYREHIGVCYISEQGVPYTHADFLRFANGEERVADQMFDGCYWQEPKMLLVEELRGAQMHLPRLSQHSKSDTWWLHFSEPPSEVARSGLQSHGWWEQTPVLWATASEEAVVPEGIAFVSEGLRDRTPQEEEAFRGELARQEGLTQEARARRAAFVASLTERVRVAEQKGCYVIDQLPRDAQAWAAFERVNGRGLRSLFLSQVAESEEELWQAVDRLAPTCAFTVTYLDGLKPRFQVKGNRERGTLTRIIAREGESQFVALIERVRGLINREAAHSRLIRRWREQNGARAGRIEEETGLQEALPALSALAPDLYPDLEAQRASSLELITRLESVQKAYAEAIEHLEGFSAEMSADQVAAFITSLEDSYHRCLRQRESAPGPVFQGQEFAYQQLARDAREWLPVPQEPV